MWPHMGVKNLGLQKLPSQEILFVSTLIISLGVYFIDANLNFPIARPQVLIAWALVIALISYFYIESKKNNIENSIQKQINIF